MRYFPILLLLLVFSGCGDGGTNGGKSTEWEVLTHEASTGSMTKVQLLEKYDVWKGEAPGVWGMGSDELVTNIWVGGNGKVTKCITWLGSPDDIMWDVMSDVLVEIYGSPFSFQINQVMWISGIELVRPLPNRYGITSGEMQVRWPIGG